MSFDNNPNLTPWRYVKQSLNNLRQDERQSIFKLSIAEQGEHLSLSIILTTNLVQNYTGVAHVKDTIQSLSYLGDAYASAPVIVAVDGSPYTTRLNAYVANLNNLCNRIRIRRPCSVIVSPSQKLLSVSTDNAIRYVTSGYVLIVQNDLPFIRNVPMRSILAAMEHNRRTASSQNLVRRVQFRWLWSSHWGEGCPDPTVDVSCCYGKKTVQAGDELLRLTSMWSDRNAVAHRSYFESQDWWNVRNASRIKKTKFPESVLSKSCLQDCNSCGNFVYGRKFHEWVVGTTNGRGSPWWCSMAFEYVTGMVDWYVELWGASLWNSFAVF